jgi:hypothetical protein
MLFFFNVSGKMGIFFHGLNDKKQQKTKQNKNITFNFYMTFMTNKKNNIINWVAGNISYHTKSKANRKMDVISKTCSLT